jgi:Spy/CpxP family protein refolding chaperone
MKKVVTVIGASLLLVVGLVALAGFSGGMCGHRHGRDPAQVAQFVTNHVEDTLDDLNATPEQRTRILAIKDRLLEAAKGLHAEHAQTHEAILDAWKADRPDAAALHALVDRRADEMKAFAHQVVDAGVEVHDTLTPDQRAKLTKKIERWHGR